MLVSAPSCPPLHLTYCLNIHAGQTWAENLAAIRQHALRVRDAVPHTGPFGLGLRLSAAAAEELAAPAALADFRTLLADEGLYAFTINGFPYGRFHAAAVKADVYRPDWRTAERRDYTVRLIDILAALLPEGVAGSISTVPGAYKPWIRTHDDVEAMGRMLAETAAHAADVRRRTGQDVCIALEPEPDCYVERTDEAIEFLTRALPGTCAPAVVGERLGVGAEESRQVLAHHVGLCLDTAHAAVEFEDPIEAIASLRQAGVRVGKVQLSAALRVQPRADTMPRLREFVDPVYLHQTAWRDAAGRVRRFADLPEALAAVQAAGTWDGELMIHFHVPLFFAGPGELQSSAAALRPEFWQLLRSPTDAPTDHLEIETYTFDVLPPWLRTPDVVESIRREYEWVLGRLGV